MSLKKPQDDASFQDEIERADQILEDLEWEQGRADDQVGALAGDHIPNTDISLEERELLDEIGASERGLDELLAELKAVDAENRVIAERNHQYEVLIRVCGTLEELDDAGGRHLFWGSDSNADRQATQLEQARQSIEAYEAEIKAAEDRRQAIVDQIGDQNLVLDSLDTALRDAMEKEERRRAEWIVENDPRPLAFRSQIMPWARGADEDSRFRRALAATVLFCLLLGLLLPMIDLPMQLRDKLTEVPERVVDVIRRELPEPEPPPPVPEPVLAEEEPPEPVEPQEQLVEEAAEEPDTSVVAEVQQAEPREQVKSKGILAFRDSFASRALDRPSAQLGSQARVRNAGEQSVGRPERSMVTTSAPGTSGGINLADISRDVGGGGQAIDGVEVTRVASAIGTGEGPDRPLSAGLSAGRTDEEIQIVFDRYKAALYRLYNRELRKDPTLRGQLVLRLTIEPDGSVSMCEVQSTDMDAPTLSEQVVNRVRGFDFGAKDDVAAVTIIYPIDFLPAG